MYYQCVPILLLCLLDELVVVGYASMTVACWITAVVPALQDFAAHGKTRRPMPTTSATTTTTVTRSTRKTHRFLSLIRSPFLYWMVVPKQWFRHFYVWGLVSLTLTLGLTAPQNSSSNNNNLWIASTTTTLLLYLHLSRRLWECCCVHQWRSGSQMHGLGYVVGALHYVWLPLVFVRVPSLSSSLSWWGAPPPHQDSGWCSRRLLLASAEPNTLQQMLAPGRTMWHHNSPFEDTTFQPGRQQQQQDDVSRFMSSVPLIVLCLWAQFQQHRHHVLLANLRRGKPKTNEHNNYSLPASGWFRHVVCPHYLAEILIYVSFVLLLWHEHAPGHRHWVLLVWVVSNLTVSARSNLQWYRDNLAAVDVQGRKAILPFLW